MPRKLIAYTFMGIFALTALLTLGGIAKIPPFDNIDDKYLWALFAALIVELVGVVIAGSRVVFSSGKKVEHYSWEITYTPNLASDFLSKVGHENKAFLASKSEVSLADLKGDKEINRDLLLLTFIYRKIQVFQNQTVSGDIFVSYDGESDFVGIGRLTFPDERHPVAFEISGNVNDDGGLSVTFIQPTRLLEYEGIVNTWIGATLPVELVKKGKGFIGQFIDSRFQLLLGEVRLRPKE